MSLIIKEISRKLIFFLRLQYVRKLRSHPYYGKLSLPWNTVKRIAATTKSPLNLDTFVVNLKDSLERCVLVLGVGQDTFVLLLGPTDCVKRAALPKECTRLDWLCKDVPFHKAKHKVKKKKQLQKELKLDTWPVYFAIVRKTRVYSVSYLNKVPTKPIQKRGISYYVCSRWLFALPLGGIFSYACQLQTHMIFWNNSVLELKFSF